MIYDIPNFDKSNYRIDRIVTKDTLYYIGEKNWLMYEENDTLITLVYHDLSQFIVIPIKELVRVIYIKKIKFICVW